MIIEWLVTTASGFVGWIGTLFPPIDLPEWVETGSDGVYAFVEGASGIGVWVPFQVLSYVLTGLLVAFLATGAVKLAREALKHVPFFGGGG